MLLLLLSMVNGLIVVLLMTWMQVFTPQQMLGRIMALLIFSCTRLAPIAQAISGVLSKWSLTILVVILGVLDLLLTIWMAFHLGLKGFSENLAAVQMDGYEQAWVGSYLVSSIANHRIGFAQKSGNHQRQKHD